MMRMILCLVLLAAACSDSGTDLDDAVHVGLRKTQFASGEPIVATITNGFDEDVVLRHCDHRLSIVVEHRVGGSWETAQQLNGPTCQAIYAAGPTSISPGKTRVETVTPDVTGRLRLRVDFGKGFTRIGYFAVSPEFIIRP